MAQILSDRSFDGRRAPLPEPQPAGPKRGRTATINLAESPLSWLRSRDMISARQYEAGEMLRSDYEIAMIGPRVTMHWGAAPLSRMRRAGFERPEPTALHLAAKKRFDGAMAAVGPGLNDVLWRVVCAGEGLARAEKTLGWPVRAGKLVLGLALDRLADHYRLG